MSKFIRPYRKLNPLLKWQHKKLQEFLTEIYRFYEDLKKYKESPDERQKEFLNKEFDRLFSTVTGYRELDKRIELTCKQKDKLLVVLEHPELPLHNNPAEIALRELVIKRNISRGTRSEHGRIAWENMMSILDTCRKLKVSFYEYLKDIFSGEHKMPKLSDLVVKKITSSPSY